MTIIIHFDPGNMNTTTYAEVMCRRDAAGAVAPTGRIHHAADGASDGLHVVDIRDTAENFQAFGPILAPILESLGVTLPEPQVSPVHNIVMG